jgi:post-segregation antitoxin (ccd killing protein)
MVVVIERDGVRYRRTSIEVREDLHQKAKDNGWNMAAVLNHALDEKVKKEGKK